MHIDTEFVYFLFILPVYFMKKWFLYLCTSLLFYQGFAQSVTVTDVANNPQDNVHKKQNKLNFEGVSVNPQGDSLYTFSIPALVFVAPPKFKNSAQARRYTRLEYNVRTVYPYVTLIRNKFKEMNVHYLSIKDEKDKKEYTKKVEQEIRAEFEGELKKLTITQGRILIKLIDRETGITSFELLQEFRGKFSAFFWQTLARVFGLNLKDAYNAEGDDLLIEDILMRIEAGI